MLYDRKTKESDFPTQSAQSCFGSPAPSPHIYFCFLNFQPVLLKRQLRRVGSEDSFHTGCKYLHGLLIRQFIFFSFDFVFRDRVSLCKPGCPGTRSVDQAGLKLTETHLPLLTECWD